MRTLAGVCLLLAAVVLAGCADPYTHTTNGAPAPPAGGELHGTVPKQFQEREPTGGGRTPEGTLRRAAQLYGNWTSETAARQFRAIAALSTGQARAQLLQVAADSGADRQQAGVRSTASVVAIDHGVVVTRERVTGPGIEDTARRYRVTLAATVRRGRGWAISRWDSQP